MNPMSPKTPLIVRIAAMLASMLLFRFVEGEGPLLYSIPVSFVVCSILIAKFKNSPWIVFVAAGSIITAVSAAAIMNDTLFGLAVLLVSLIANTVTIVLSNMAIEAVETFYGNRERFPSTQDLAVYYTLYFIGYYAGTWNGLVSLPNFTLQIVYSFFVPIPLCFLMTKASQWAESLSQDSIKKAALSSMMVEWVVCFGIALIANASSNVLVITVHASTFFFIAHFAPYLVLKKSKNSS